MSVLIRIELLKLRTTRATWGLVALAALLTAFDAVVRSGTAGGSNTPALSTSAGLRDAVTVTGFSLLISLILGVLVASGEFRHQTASLTYLQTPRRDRVLAAKGAAAAIGGAVLGVVGAGITTLVGCLYASVQGGGLALSAGSLARYGLGCVVGAAVLGALGVGLGSLVRVQMAAVIGVFVWAFFLETILGNVVHAVQPYLPFTAATTLGGSPLGSGGFGFGGPVSPRHPLPFVGALGLCLLLVLALALLAARTAVRRDVVG